MGNYFVRVEESNNVRRQLLESSKLCVFILKQEHRVNEIRQQKKAVIAQLRDELKELTFLLNTLEKELPVLTKKQLIELQPRVFKLAAPEKQKIVVPETQVEELSKLQRLEQSLELIEGRLKKL